MGSPLPCSRRRGDAALPMISRNQSPGQEPESAWVFQHDTPHCFPGNSHGWRFFSSHRPRTEHPWGSAPPGCWALTCHLRGARQRGDSENAFPSSPSPGTPARCKVTVHSPIPNPPQWQGSSTARPQTATLTWMDPAPDWPRQQGSPETISQCRLSSLILGWRGAGLHAPASPSYCNQGESSRDGDNRAQRLPRAPPSLILARSISINAEKKRQKTEKHGGEGQWNKGPEP